MRHLEMISRLLLDGGYVVLPSDTAYAIAALAVRADTQKRINKILSRPDWPLSLAFPSHLAARKWISPNIVVDCLVEKFCPGPITIVCKAEPSLPASFFSLAISSENRTIGVRIPDSLVEREVAACTNFPITTVAIREPGGGDVITSFDKAVEIVTKGIVKVRPKDNATWCAIEADADLVYDQHSTVVQVLDNAGLELLRPGRLPFEEIQAAVKDLPSTAFRGSV
jgi:L-threonylcarbamoyladenylate synthase